MPHTCRKKKTSSRRQVPNPQEPGKTQKKKTTLRVHMSDGNMISKGKTSGYPTVVPQTQQCGSGMTTSEKNKTCDVADKVLPTPVEFNRTPLYERKKMSDKNEEAKPGVSSGKPSSAFYPSGDLENQRTCLKLLMDLDRKLQVFEKAKKVMNQHLFLVEREEYPLHKQQ